MKTRIIGLLGLAAVLLTACLGSDQGQDLSDEELISTAAARVQAEMEITQTALSADSAPASVGSDTESPAAVEEIDSVGIPGLEPIDVIYLADGYGFSCAEPELVEGSLFWTCTLELDDCLYQVKLWGQTQNTVELMEISAFYFELENADFSDLTSLLFGDFSEAPFLGMDSSEAKTWVTEAISQMGVVGEERVNSFQGVRYYLYALPSMHVMEIGSLQ